VRLYQVIDTADQVFMIMEYASGGMQLEVLSFLFCHSIYISLHLQYV